MGLFHPIRRIDPAPWRNSRSLRQSESAALPTLGTQSRSWAQWQPWPNPTPILTQITAQFGNFTVENGRAGYTLSDRRSHVAVARLRPLTGTDRFELLYWSAVRGRWRTFGNLGVMKLRLQDAYEIVSNDPIFKVRRTG